MCALVDAYLARRALDYLVGFTLSPGAVAQAAGGSFGRPRAVGRRAPGLRPRARIEKFVAREYWSISAKLATPRRDISRPASSEPTERRFSALDIGAGAEADAFTLDLETAAFKVVVGRGQADAKRNPPPPFTTSTMQQEARASSASRPRTRCGLAQRLYEGIDVDGETVGLITYMRTDGVRHGAGSHYGRARHDRQAVWRGIRAGRATQLSEQIQDRTGSPRGGAPDRSEPRCPRKSRGTSIAIRPGSTS